MPVMLPARLGVSQSEALREAYAHATAGDPELLTIALYHPAFVDSLGNPTAVYCVRDMEPLDATLELDAPLHAGQQVTFEPIPFDFTRPEESDGNSPPEVTVSLDNVARDLMPWLAAASASQTPITMIVRVYLPSDTSAPHENPPMSLVLRNVTATATTVSAKAGYGDLINSRFPRKEYTRETHPGLAS